MVDIHVICYWLQCGLSGLVLFVLLALGYGATDKLRQMKLILAGSAMLWSILWSGVLALGTTYWLRGDGVHILWGRWAMTTGLVILFSMHLTLSLGLPKMARKVAFILAAIAATMPLATAITDSHHFSHGAHNALIMFTVVGPVFWLLYALWVALTGLGYNLWMGSAPSKSEGYKGTADGNANAIQGYMPAILAIVAFIMFGIFNLFAALGREAFRVYISETLQTVLVMVATLVMFVICGLIHVLVNPDGSFNIRWGAIFGDGTTEADQPVVVFGRGATPEEKAALLAAGDEMQHGAGTAAHREDQEGDRAAHPSTGRIHVFTNGKWTPTDQFVQQNATMSAGGADDV